MESAFEKWFSTQGIISPKESWDAALEEAAKMLNRAADAELDKYAEGIRGLKEQK